MTARELKRILYDNSKRGLIIEQLNRPLTEEEIIIIALRFYQRRSWEYIALQIHTSRSTACRIEKNLLNDLLKVTGNI